MKDNNLKISDMKLEGLIDKWIKFIQERQIKRIKWQHLVYQFNVKDDSKDAGWRGEFWGKLLRGACTIYQYTKDEELYNLLECTIKDMLDVQEETGRFSTYDITVEFSGWDMWCRKYVMIGMLYFYDICKNQNLKMQIITALSKHLDYIISKVGKGEDKIDIGLTSEAWGTVNSHSILEAVVRLYRITDNVQYLNFAKYIVESGGSVDCDLIELAYNDVLLPYQYKYTKAYEIMSFFIGVFEYYLVTGEDKYKVAVINYAKRIAESEMTVVGGIGCKGEMYSFASQNQTNEKYTGKMQETCVTVNWIDLCSRLLMYTGEAKYADYIELSSYNVMFGAINSLESNNNGGLYFDSYSPLLKGKRGGGIGGLKLINGLFINGCCSAIGAFGLGIIPMNAVIVHDGVVDINFYETGCIEFTDAEGEKTYINVSGSYPKDNKVVINVNTQHDIRIRLRNPAYSDETICKINGEYSLLNREYTEILCKNNDIIELEFDFSVKRIKGDKHDDNTFDYFALKKGPIMLAKDKRLCDSLSNCVEFEDSMLLLEEKTDYLKSDKIMEVSFKQEDGNICTMIDYASAGKTWDEDSEMAVWLPTKRS